MENKYNLIVARTDKNYIGLNNELLFKIPKDLNYFKQLTINNIVVMGRKTYESIGKPLPNRINIVISSKDYENIDNSLYFVKTYEELDKLISFIINDEKIFVIGGGSIYNYFISNNYIETYHITTILNDAIGDTIIDLPDFNNYKKNTIINELYNGVEYMIEVYNNH